MKTLRNALTLAGALGAVAAFAQPAPVTPPQPPVAPPPPPIVQPPMRPFRYMAPMGMQARYTFEVIRTNRADLGITDAQMKTITDARDADDKAMQARSTQKMTLRNELQDLADANPPDMAKLEAKVRDLKKMEGDEMMADFRLTAAFKAALTPEQRDKIKTMAPKFEPMMPGMPRAGMPGGPMMPGMPGGPAVPGAPPVPQPPAAPRTAP